MTFPFLANRGAAGQLFRAVDIHGAGAADRRPTGIAQGESAVELVLDPDQGFEDGRAPSDVETIILVVRMLIGFGIESLDGKRETHGNANREAGKRATKKIFSACTSP